MEIEIHQESASIRDKYQIYIDGQQRHHANYKILALLSELYLYEWDSDLPRFTINKKLQFYAANYTLRRIDGSVYEFTTKSLWKGHYQCIGGLDIYDIYGHRGRKYSVFKNGNQVAWWTKNAVSWLEGDNYKIIADNSCDYNLIISFCLIIDNYKSQGKKSVINIDIGRIGPEAKKFDVAWLPKI